MSHRIARRKLAAQNLRLAPSLQQATNPVSPPQQPLALVSIAATRLMHTKAAAHTALSR